MGASPHLEIEQHWHDEAAMSAYLLRPFFIDENDYAARSASLALVIPACVRLALLALVFPRYFSGAIKRRSDG